MAISDALMTAIGTLTVASFVAGIQYLNLQRERLNQKIATVKWQNDYFIDFRKWSDEAMLQLSEAMHLCERQGDELEAKALMEALYQLRIKLSAQIDCGRWFFPNHVAAYGMHKEAAFQGYRHEVLDGLVSAYKSVCMIKFTGSADNREQRKSIQVAKRIFTGEIQKILDPRRRNEEFRNLVGAAGQGGAQDA